MKAQSLSITGTSKHRLKLRTPRSHTSKNENKIFVYLTCIYIITWYLQLGSRIEFLGAIRFEFLLGAFLSFFSLFKLLSQNDKSSPLKAPALTFILIIAFYTVFSYDHATSWNIFIDRVIKFSMIAVFFAAFIRTPWALKLAISAFLLAMLKLGQEGFVGLVSGALVWENQGVMRLHGSTLMYRHPNSFSGLAVGCLPFVYFLYPAASRYWQKLLLILLFGFCLTIIIFTASRTGYVATLLLLIFAILRLTGKHRKNILIISFILLPPLLFFVPDQYLNRLQSIYTLEESEGSSAKARLLIAQDAIHIASNKPWGIGVGAFPHVRGTIFGRFQDTHNLYLEIITNLSIAGLIAFLWLIKRIIFLNMAMQKTLSNIEDADAKFVASVSKALVGFVLARLFLGFFGMDTYEIYWWFAIGLTISTYRIKVSMLSSSNPKGKNTFLNEEKSKIHFSNFSRSYSANG